MTTLNSAFQTLLSSVSDLNLNDGDFLKMNNLLKKAFDSDKEIFTETTDMKIHLIDCIGSNVKIELYEVIREPYQNHPTLKPIIAINYRITCGENVKTLSTDCKKLQNVFKGWIMRKRPTKVELEYDGFTTAYTYSDLFKTFQKEDNDEDEENDMFYEYDGVMGHRLSSIIKQCFYTSVYNSD